MQAVEQNERKERVRFFLKNLFRGFIWLAVVVGGYFYLKSHYNFTLQSLLGDLYDQPAVIFLIFFVSETVFGIIPPELFMIWSLRNEVLLQYIINVAALSVISYIAGVIGYYIGFNFATTRFYRTVRVTYLKRFEKYLTRFGGFLVIVAAMTPLPFAGICMLMGAIRFPYRRFLAMALTRFLRFLIYAIVVWEANILQ